MNFIEFILLPQNFPFTATLATILIVLTLEFVMALLGVGLSEMFDSLMPNFDLDSMQNFNGHSPLSLLGFGKIPVFVILVAFALAFGLGGWILQWTIFNLGMSPIPAWIASLITLVPTFPATVTLSRIFALVIPKDETFVGSKEDVVGKMGVITQGTARSDLPAQCRVSDGHGGSFYLQAVPNDGVDPIPEGTSVIVISRTKDHNYAVVPFI